MRWRALQTGRVYINKRKNDAEMSLEDLKEMSTKDRKSFINRVSHFGTSLRGTKQYWHQQRSKLTAMINNLGLPTAFFTHSAADLQWPELHRLLVTDENKSKSANLIDNPAIASWFFHEKIQKYIKTFYTDILGAVDFWFRYEWQHRGSVHVHGLVWLKDAPQMERLKTTDPIARQAAIDEVSVYIIKHFFYRNENFFI